MNDLRKNFPPLLQTALSSLIEKYHFNIRHSQEEMMKCILDTLVLEQKTKIALIEAPTGTGKSMGYLLPLLTANTDKKIVVVTGMISLQEQLFFKDIPLLQNLLFPFKASLAKGRGRYVCPEKLNHNKEISHILTVWNNNFQKNIWNGQSETLTESDEVKKKYWPLVSVDSKSCKDSSCPSFDICPFHNAKKEWKDSKVIIANHDLLLSDIRFGGGILGSLDNTIFVIDEAHHFPGKATHVAATEYEMNTLAHIKKYIQDHHPAMVNEKAFKNLDKVEALWQKHWAVHTKSISKFNHLTITETLRAQAESLWTNVKDAADDFKARIELDFKTLKLNSQSAWQDIGECSKLLQSIENIEENCRVWAQPFDEKVPPIARWVEVNNHKYTLHQEPTMAGDWLAKKFFNHAYMVVMTSATLRSVGGFNWFKERAGLHRYKPKELLLNSPFDFPKQGSFHVVHGAPDVNKPEYSAYIIESVKTLLSDNHKGVLLLFTSQKLMQEVYEALPQFHTDMLMQYSLPTQHLVKNHKIKIDSKRRSILMGTMSFMEGLDLPGDYCTQVILTKLPFSAGETPAEKILGEWLEMNNRSSFREMVLPEAGVNLVQASGRLIRRESDSGEFILLDSRVITKASAYGSALLKLVPNFKRKDWKYEQNSLNRK